MLCLTKCLLIFNALAFIGPVTSSRCLHNATMTVNGVQNLRCFTIPFWAALSFKHVQSSANLSQKFSIVAAFLSRWLKISYLARFALNNKTWLTVDDLMQKLITIPGLPLSRRDGQSTSESDAFNNQVSCVLQKEQDWGELRPIKY